MTLKQDNSPAEDKMYIQDDSPEGVEEVPKGMPFK